MRIGPARIVRDKHYHELRIKAGDKTLIESYWLEKQEKAQAWVVVGLAGVIASLTVALIGGVFFYTGIPIFFKVVVALFTVAMVIVVANISEA